MFSTFTDFRAELSPARTMSYSLTRRMPIIRIKVRIGPVTLRYLEEGFDRNCELWPAAIPKEMDVEALVDTGASVSIIDSSIAEKMNLIPLGFCAISGFDSLEGDSGNVKKYPNYEAGLVILQASGETPVLTIKAGQIVAHQLDNPGFQAIIGMDVLKHCQFLMDGPSGSFEITAPHSLVEEMSSVSPGGN